MEHNAFGFMRVGFAVLYLCATGGFFYLMYSISKSLKRIADRLDKIESK